MTITLADNNEKRHSNEGLTTQTGYDPELKTWVCEACNNKVWPLQTYCPKCGGYLVFKGGLK